MSTRNFLTEAWDSLYQLIDPFTLFSIRFIQNKKFDSWKDYINSPGYNSWRGSAFEIVCLNHINQIKSALGISGIETNEFAWKSSNTEKGAQIDLSWTGCRSSKKRWGRKRPFISRWFAETVINKVNILVQFRMLFWEMICLTTDILWIVSATSTYYNR